MPSNLVMPKWKHNKLHSGSKKGPVVKKQKQAVAIMLSEKRKEKVNGGKYPEKKKTKKSVILVFDLNKGRGGFRQMAGFTPEQEHAARESKVALGQEYKKVLESHGYGVDRKKQHQDQSSAGIEYNPKKYNYTSRHVYTHPEKEGEIHVEFPHKPTGQVRWRAPGHSGVSSTPAGLDAHLRGVKGQTVGAKAGADLTRKSKRTCSICKGKHCVRVIYKSNGQEEIGIRACPVCNPLGSVPIEKGE